MSTDILSKKPRCPVCHKASTAQFKPFCSNRCKDADLGNWVMGKYAIPTAADEPEDGLPDSHLALDEDDEGYH